MRHALCRDGFLATTAAAIMGLLWLVLGIGGAAADAVAADIITVYYDIRRGVFNFFSLLYNYITNDCLHAPTAPTTS